MGGSDIENETSETSVNDSEFCCNICELLAKRHRLSYSTINNRCPVPFMKFIHTFGVLQKLLLFLELSTM